MTESILAVMGPLNTHCGVVEACPFTTSFTRLPALWVYCTFSVSGISDRIVVVGRSDLRMTVSSCEGDNRNELPPLSYSWKLMRNGLNPSMA